MILAAGYGTRLFPATRLRPKPLLEFFGVPLLHIALRQLEEVGARDIVVNSHYFTEQVRAALGAWEKGVKKNPAGAPVVNLRLSEEPQILGTGGALARIHGIRAGRNLLVVNGDLVHLHDLKAFAQACSGSGAIASMGSGRISDRERRPSGVWERGWLLLVISVRSPRRILMDLLVYSF